MQTRHPNAPQQGTLILSVLSQPLKSGEGDRQRDDGHLRRLVKRV
jgi:hypothetical protein